jgi:uncharacterized membrane protein
MNVADLDLNLVRQVMMLAQAPFIPGRLLYELFLLLLELFNG